MKTVKYTQISESKKIGSNEYLSYCLNGLPKMNIIDLGCGHGGYSVFISGLGHNVTGYDARTERMQLENKSVKWVQGLVESVELKEYNLIVASGILYHLTKQQQIDLFEKIKKSNAEYLIINTHFAILDYFSNPINKGNKYLFKADNEGCFYDERENFKERLLASYSNRLSYWFSFHRLIDLISNAGFTDIEILKPFVTNDRAFFFCRKQLNNI